MLKAGDQFGPYRAIKSLGKGGMGEVWLLQHEANGYLFAVKIQSDANAAVHESRTRFVREAQLAMSVDHDNLVRVFDVGEDPDTGLCYMLMEYVSGGSLRDRIKARGPMPVEQAVRIVRSIASVLEVTAARKIVHRDIKPDNILFTQDGVPKLSDLGIARVHADKALTTVTVDGSVVGTPVYMAPEQMINSRSVDTRADIFSLGVVFFEMLAGRRPWADEGLVQMMARAVQCKEIVDIRNYRRDAPEMVANLVARMCAAKVAERIASPRQIVSICDKILANTVKPTAPRLVGGVRVAAPLHASSPKRAPLSGSSRVSASRCSAFDEYGQPEGKSGPSPALVAVMAIVGILIVIALLSAGVAK